MNTAMTNSQEVIKASLKALVLADEPSKQDAISAMTFAPEETFSRIKVLPDHEIVDIKNKGKQVVTFVNSLGHQRVQLVSVMVNVVNVMVSTFLHICTFCGGVSSLQVQDSSNNTVVSQLNPVFRGDSLAKDKFQLIFVASLPALGAAHYLITTGNEQAVRAELQYINFNPPSRSDFVPCTMQLIAVTLKKKSEKVLCK